MLIPRNDLRLADMIPMPMLKQWLRATTLCGTLALAAMLSGCSGDDTADNSNPSTNVAGDNEPGSPAGPAATATNSAYQPAYTSDQPGTGGGQVATQGPMAQPPADPGLTLDAYKTPDGTADELLTFMRNIDQRMPQGDSQQERLADMIQMQRATIEAAEKVAINQTATNEQLLEAAHRKMSAFAVLDDLGVAGVRQEVDAYLSTLIKSPNGELQQLAKLVTLSRSAVDLLEGTTDDPKLVANHLKQLVAELEPSEDVFSMTQQIASQLEVAGYTEAATTSFDAIRARYATSDNPRIQEALAYMKLQDRLEELQFTDKLKAIMGKEEGAVEPFMVALNQLFQETKPSNTLFDISRQTAQILESNEHYAEALQVMRWTQASFAQSDNERLKTLSTDSIALAEKRLTLIGKQLPLAGMVALDGQPFDWNAYRGKVVLVDFWASWCGPCIEEFPEMKAHYAAYRQKGFEILGVNLDDTHEAAKDFLVQQPLPWRTVASGDPEAQGFANPAATFAGVESIPFMVLVGPDGVVRELHVRGSKLEERLQQIFGPVAPEAVPEGAVPANPAAGAGPIQSPGPALNGTSQFRSRRVTANSFVSLLDDTADEPVDNQAVETISRERTKAAKKEDRKFGEISGIEIDDSINPYAPDAGLSKLELAQYLLDMRDKPKSIQRRPGFSEGMLQGCDRLIEATGGKGRYYEIAVLEKLNTLHGAASFGDAEADAALEKFVESLGQPERTKIAAEVVFHRIERRLIEAADSESAKVDDLLTELADFYAETELEEKHLRMASSTVKAINKLEDDDAREKHFEEFGKLFASSKNKELARYGKRIAKVESGGVNDLVGKPVELAGVTTDGIPLNWGAYRGKVVIVDFWATWCGPCRREMPNLQAAYEEHRDAGLDVIGISLDQDLEALAEYLDEQNIVWPTLSGEEAQELATRYGVRGIPTMMLVDAEGNVAAAGHNVAALLPKAKELLAALK